ncbi:hypothetical protein ACFE04_016248 [Oxalis oulophora]
MSWLSWQAWGYFVFYGHGGSRIEILEKKQKPEKLDSSLLAYEGCCVNVSIFTPSFFIDLRLVNVHFENPLSNCGVGFGNCNYEVATEKYPSRNDFKIHFLSAGSSLNSVIPSAGTQIRVDVIVFCRQ